MPDGKNGHLPGRPEPSQAPRPRTEGFFLKSGAPRQIDSRGQRPVQHIRRKANELRSRTTARASPAFALRASARFARSSQRSAQTASPPALRTSIVVRLRPSSATAWRNHDAKHEARCQANLSVSSHRAKKLRPHGIVQGPDTHADSDPGCLSVRVRLCVTMREREARTLSVTTVGSTPALKPQVSRLKAVSMPMPVPSTRITPSSNRAP